MADERWIECTGISGTVHTKTYVNMAVVVAVQEVGGSSFTRLYTSPSDFMTVKEPPSWFVPAGRPSGY